MLPTEDPAESHFEGHNNSGEATRPPRLSETAQTYGPRLHPPPHLPQGFQYVILHDVQTSKQQRFYAPNLGQTKSYLCTSICLGNKFAC